MTVPAAGLTTPVPDLPAPLAITLQLAVPLHIDELRHRDDRQRITIAGRCADVIAAHGDDLQYGGKHCAAAFNALARGLAAAAYQPGGVTFAGALHWCTAAHEGCPDRDVR